MKQFLSFVKKEFLHIFRDSRTMLILLGMPIAMMIIFGFAITTEVRNIKLAVWDLSKDITTTQIIERFSANNYFVLVEELNSSQDVERVLKEGKVNMVMVFDSDFHSNAVHTGEASIQLIIDATDPNQGISISNYATSILTAYQQEQAVMMQPTFVINPQLRMLYNPQLESAYNFVPGVMGLILMLICAMMTSIAIVREKEKGSMEVLLVSPVKPLYIILSKAVPYFALSMVNLTTILLLSFFLLKVPFEGNFFLIIFVSFLFIFVSLLIGILISNVVDSQVAAMLLSGMGLMMPTIVLSGMIYPIESMPDILQWISTIVPARWYISAIKKLMIQGVGGGFVIKEMLVLSGMILFLIVVNLKKFKVRM